MTDAMSLGAEHYIAVTTFRRTGKPVEGTGAAGATQAARWQ